MNTLRELLGLFEINPEKIKLDLDKITIKDITFFEKKNTLKITLDSPKIILDTERCGIEEMIENSTEFEKVSIYMEYGSFNKNKMGKVMKKYWLNIFHMLKEISPSLEKLKNMMDYMYLDEKIYIKFPTYFSYNIIKNSDFESKLKKRVHDELGIEIGLKLEYVETKVNVEDFLAEIESKSDEISNMIVLENIEAEENAKKMEDAENDEKYVIDYEDLSRIIYGEDIPPYITPIKEITNPRGTVCVEGDVFSIEMKEEENRKTYVKIYITDFEDSIECCLYLSDNELKELRPHLEVGKRLIIKGDVLRNFKNEIYLIATGIKLSEKEERIDDSDEKRVELHAHTTMSNLDSTISAKKLISTAIKWGHKAVAITDHAVVQGFPDAMMAANDDIKVIYGVEGDMVDDDIKIFNNVEDRDFNSTFIVFDLETTGLSPVNDKITEIGAVKIRNLEVVDRFSVLINPEMDISYKIQSLTGITNELLEGKPVIETVLPEFIDFIDDGILVAHNATFDIGFLSKKAEQMNLKSKYTSIDTLIMSRGMFPDQKKHTLDVMAKKLNIPLINHHRAVEDAETTAHIFIKMLNMIKDKGADNFEKANEILGCLDYKKIRPNHVTLYAQNYMGLKNLYRIISDSHIEHIAKEPLMLRRIIEEYREGILIGSACAEGELFQAIRSNKSDEEIKKIIEFYDFIELMPISNYSGMIEKGEVKDESELQFIYSKMYDLAKEYGKIPVATGDVHYLEPYEGVHRKILANSIKFKRVDTSGVKHFRTTGEMMKEFDYLGVQKAYEVVVTNPNLVADMFEKIKPIPDETFPPKIEGSDEMLRNMCNEKAERIYGKPVPEIVQKRLDRELNSIISNGYAVMYIIAQKLVTKSLSDGYLVGSRGSVGSSFAATMADITEVNPLPAHYICPNPECKHSIFFAIGEKGSGVDMEDRNCPKCGSRMIKEGHDIPFEVFLGFNGDKEPDIDLNFSGVYQPTIHKYTEELFGEGYVYRAGTTGTVADKTAYGLAKKYSEEKNLNLKSAEILRLAKGCIGTKRTTGQHPGGVMVVPHYKDIHDFSPIQYPANDPSCGVKTTHFDYHSISGRILKLDILGHDGPTIIRMLEDIIGFKITDVPLDDPETMSLFTSTKALGVTPEQIDCEVGSLAIPEFGTKFVRQMLLDTKPTTFTELVRISGLSHGTNVWVGNAQDLVRENVVGLKDVISTRDDIMNYLIFKGLPPKESFTIMERVRKGKGLQPEHIEDMKKNNVPEWYIDSCQKISYMFPKAHAVAYVMTSFRIAYCKVHHPEAFYATFFTTKVDFFDADVVIKGYEYMREKKKYMDENKGDLTEKEKNQYAVLEVAIEMYARNIRIEKVDIYKSCATEFKVIGKGVLLPPLSSLNGIGENAAKSIVEEREKGEFISKEDMLNRCTINKNVVEALTNHGSIDFLTEKNQISIMEIINQ